MDRWWCFDGTGPQPRTRDPREDDSDYYRDPSGRWVKRREWTAADMESLRDWDTYCRYIQETTAAQRERLKADYKRSQGLVQWFRFPHIWAESDKIDELEAGFLEGEKRERRNQAQLRDAGRLDRFWC